MIEERINANISKDKTYPIFISIDKISTIEAHLRDFTNANKFLIVISEKVNKLYGKELNFKNSIKYVLKDGEKEKNIKNYQKIMNFAIKNNLERKDCIVAIGGGVVGDIAGFVASTYLRGIDLIHIPTTLLACVDSSVGGKTGINTQKGKNLIGSFYQPKAVICNVNFIKTLDERQFKTGLAEVLKYAFIERNCQIDGTTNFLEYLAKHEKQVLERDIRTIALLVRISLTFKVFVVEQDERE
ncbi:MAG: 3-dehydroquinate synthase, partial [bacterium]|nr:3-dehydroquinate synthase [bacterium]